VFTEEQMSWGPSHQTTRGERFSRRLAGLLTWFVLLFVASKSDILSDIFVVLTLAIVIWWVLSLIDRRHPIKLVSRIRALRGPRSFHTPDSGLASGGIHLGVARNGRRRQARHERAVLVLGPPRAGKTTAVIIPSLLSHAGPVVSTSTKSDVMAATAAARAGLGRVWQFDPTGSSPPVAGVEQLRWSPVLGSAEWDGALLMARAMVNGAQVGRGSTDASHWTRRAQALLAPLLHAAALAGRDIEDVVDWVARHEIDEPGALLEQFGAVRLATGQLVGLQNTEARERSSIFSASADALDGYTSQAALAAASSPNFFAARFVTSQDTIYIHAPGERQHLVAPLVCGLLSEIRRATYDHHRNDTLPREVLFALDEVANIAPLDELPQIASEGASQGLLLLAALQDLSQARARWGDTADGFLTLFGTKLLLRGIADHRTLETISAALGEYDRQVVSHTRARGGAAAAMVSTIFDPSHRGHHPRPTQTVSTQRTRVLSAGDIARIPAGQALHLDGLAWELLTLTPAYATEPWRTLTATPSQ
jgi:type IV secretion system protein VirD4